MENLYTWLSRSALWACVSRGMCKVSRTLHGFVLRSGDRQKNASNGRASICDNMLDIIDSLKVVEGASMRHKRCV